MMGKRIRPPTLSRDKGHCSVCPAGTGGRSQVGVVIVEHEDALTREENGRKVRDWFGFCLRCARLIGKAAAR
jgi:hypothetical protein